MTILRFKSIRLIALFTAILFVTGCEVKLGPS